MDAHSTPPTGSATRKPSGPPTIRFGRTRRIAKRFAVGGTVAAAMLFTASCINLHADNPAFPATTAQIDAEHKRMKAEPVKLARPVIVLSGYRSPSGSSSNLARKIRKLTGAEKDRVVAVSYMFHDTIEGPARKVVAFVEEKFPSDDPDWTTEVDVVAISMGGLVARAAAANPELIKKKGNDAGAKRLKIHTLYTLASPHRGAVLSDLITIDPASRSMVAGSGFLTQLDAELENADYKVVPYAVLHDRWVGAKRSAPIGQEPIWVPGRLIFSHHMVSLNRRIQADLARRLRGEEPLGLPSEPPRN